MSLVRVRYVHLTLYREPQSNMGFSEFGSIFQMVLGMNQSIIWIPLIPKPREINMYYQTGPLGLSDRLNQCHILYRLYTVW